MNNQSANEESKKQSNFIREIIEEDLSTRGGRARKSRCPIRQNVHNAVRTNCPIGSVQAAAPTTEDR